MTEQAQDQTTDLGQHGHAAAQLEDPEHGNPHAPSEEAIQAENEALGHDNAEQFQQ